MVALKRSVGNSFIGKVGHFDDGILDSLYTPLDHRPM